MTPTTVTTPAPEKVTVKRSVFDLTKFEKTSLEKEIEIVNLDPAKGLQAILEVCNNDESQAVTLFNKAYKRVQISEAKASIMTDNLVSPKVVSGFVNQFKPVFPLDPKKVDSKGDPTSEAKKEQTTKIYAMIRANDALLQAIRTIAAATAELDEDETDGGSDESTE